VSLELIHSEGPSAASAAGISPVVNNSIALSGLLPTHPSRLQYTFFNDDIFEDGYDTDGHQGLSVHDFSDEEDKLPSPETASIPPEAFCQAIPPLSPASELLTIEETKRMSVTELRDELGRRKQSKSGKKQDLGDRLQNCIRSGILPSNQPDPHAAPNIPGFPPGCRWISLPFEEQPLPELSHLHGDDEYDDDLTTTTLSSSSTSSSSSSIISIIKMVELNHLVYP